jgi:hypothetical protein
MRPRPAPPHYTAESVHVPHDPPVAPPAFAADWRRPHAQHAPDPHQRAQPHPQSYAPVYSPAPQPLDAADDQGFLTPIDEGRGERALNPFGSEPPVNDAERQRFGSLVANAIHRRRGVTGAAAIVGAVGLIGASLDHHPTQHDEHDYAQSAQRDLTSADWAFSDDR